MGGIIARAVVAVLCLTVTLTGCQQAPPPAYESNYTPTTPPDPSLYVGIVGDSYTGGSPSGGRGKKGWPAITTRMLNDQGIPAVTKLRTESGAGYFNDGIHNHYRFRDLASQAAGNRTSLVMLCGSGNDQGAPPEELTRMVRQTLPSRRKPLRMQRFW
ncbi:hypothetical protein [Mycolicibacterium baixiangningiae]|uniref:hypothetical protein n=1 Tax=Mycolicibacterium baixiangningiae TaxID=2761578 RepID=UPI0018D06C9A|nr:hypothetical protein [Mycolicibacterium baixiangningiae]